MTIGGSPGTSDLPDMKEVVGFEKGRKNVNTDDDRDNPHRKRRKEREELRHPS